MKKFILTSFIIIITTFICFGQVVMSSKYFNAILYGEAALEGYFPKKKTSVQLSTSYLMLPSLGYATAFYPYLRPEIRYYVHKWAEYDTYINVCYQFSNGRGFENAGGSGTIVAYTKEYTRGFGTMIGTKADYIKRRFVDLGIGLQYMRYEYQRFDLDGNGRGVRIERCFYPMISLTIGHRWKFTEKQKN
jgi:hypothetical protein